MNIYNEIERDIKEVLLKTGKNNVKLHHFHKISKDEYMCDVSYTCKNNNSKSVYQTNVIFAFNDEKWTSSMPI